MTTQTKHAPGPWKTDYANGLRVVVGDKSTIAWIDFWVTPECQKQKSIEEQDANARLIASAPELLEALETITSSYSGFKKSKLWNEVDEAVMDKARQAIANAREEM